MKKLVKVKISNLVKTLVFVICLPLLLISCKSSDGKFKLPGGDARKFPADPKKRVEQNLKEGRGFRLAGDNGLFGNNSRGGVFEFASSNELWRASLDVLDFMPLASVNYSGGIIITDWYNNTENSNESIKISVRFLTNEIRSDALDINVFTKRCSDILNCKVYQTNEVIAPELTKEILKLATKYEKSKQDKTKEKNKDYKYPNLD